MQLAKIVIVKYRDGNSHRIWKRNSNFLSKQYPATISECNQFFWSFGHIDFQG